MDEPTTRSRNIELDHQEYAFPFDSPSGEEQLMECTLFEGTGTVTLYEIVADNERVQVGDSVFLSRAPHNSFYIALKTPKRRSQWEITFRGTGRFKLEFPDLDYDIPVYPARVSKIDLTKEYDKKGRRKERS